MGAARRASEGARDRAPAASTAFYGCVRCGRGPGRPFIALGGVPAPPPGGGRPMRLRELPAAPSPRASRASPPSPKLGFVVPGPGDTSGGPQLRTWPRAAPRSPRSSPAPHPHPPDRRRSGWQLRGGGGAQGGPDSALGTRSPPLKGTRRPPTPPFPSSLAREVYTA